MTDIRVQKLANLLINYSLEVKSGEKMLISADLPAEELALEAYKAALKAGAHVTLISSFPTANEIFYKNATDVQLEFISPVMKLYEYETTDRILTIFADQNTRTLSGIDPAKRAKWLRANNILSKLWNEREGKGQWCSTIFPTDALAQEANMSLSDFEDFVYHAGMLDRDNPIAEWKTLSTQMQRLADWLNGHDKVVLKGRDVDLSMAVKGRLFEIADGKVNFPDGEVATSPIEDSVNGWIRFSFPAMIMGTEVTNIQLWFENGRVVKENAERGLEVLTALLNTDSGSRYLGELAVGTNYNITRISKHMLFDEKMGGTIHVALGESFSKLGGKNQSGLHWDILCDMREGEITVDGELFYRKGKPVLWSEELTHL